MKRMILMVMATTMVAGGTAMSAKAAETPSSATTATAKDDFCRTHCNLMDLRKKVDSLKTQQNGPDKLATKEHLKKDIDRYEQELRDLKAKLEQE